MNAIWQVLLALLAAVGLLALGWLTFGRLLIRFTRIKKRHRK